MNTMRQPVDGGVGAGVLNAHYDEQVLELRAEAGGRKGRGVFILEDNGHKVIANVTLAHQLEKRK